MKFSLQRDNANSNTRYVGSCGEKIPWDLTRSIDKGIFRPSWKGNVHHRIKKSRTYLKDM
jgi:hypothetical protein